MDIQYLNPTTVRLYYFQYSNYFSDLLFTWAASYSRQESKHIREVFINIIKDSLLCFRLYNEQENLMWTFLVKLSQIKVGNAVSDFPCKKCIFMAISHLEFPMFKGWMEGPWCGAVHITLASGGPTVSETLCCSLLSF